MLRCLTMGDIFLDLKQIKGTVSIIFLSPEIGLQYPVEQGPKQTSAKSGKMLLNQMLTAANCYGPNAEC